MEGYELYEIYQATLAEQGLEVDPWDMLDDADRYAWDACAKAKVTRAA